MSNLAKRVQAKVMCNCRPIKRGETVQDTDDGTHATGCDYAIWYNKFIAEKKRFHNRCRSCGKFVSTFNEYCPDHDKVYPICHHFKPMFDSNICDINAPHSCKRAIAEKECPFHVQKKKKPKKYSKWKEIKI